jgi:hypothetical protein
MKVVGKWRFEIPFSSVFFPAGFLPSSSAKTLLPSFLPPFVPRRFVIERVLEFASGLAHDECHAQTTQVPLLQSFLPS